MTTEGDEAEEAGQGPQTFTFLYENEQFTVSGFERSLPDLSSVSERGALVKAGLTSTGTALGLDSWHAVARAIVSPDSAAAQLRAQKGRLAALIEEHVEGATLRSLHTRAWLTELFPGLQPRTGQEALPIEDPHVLGDIDDTGKPLACVVYTYRDLAHLRAHLRQTIAATRRANPDPYDQSILARRITRAVIAHPARLEFTDGSEPIDVLVVRDGITRLTSAWALLTGEDSPGPEQIARTATDLLLAEKPQRRGMEKPRSQRMAVGRQEALAGLQAEFYQGLGSQHPADRSVRLGQTLVVPAQITVGLRMHGATGLPAEEVFDDAVRSILASVHVEFKVWESAAQNVEVGSRALRRVHLSGQTETALLEGTVGLALGRRSPEELPQIFNDQRIPGTPLWRAVYLVHQLTRPEVFDQVKRHAKDIKGTRRMTTPGYAELLGPIIDLPWRGAKSATLKQARNAWANGGVLSKAVMGEWSPVPCEDFTTLVPPALAGDRDAQRTLAVAGGTALLTDKLVTRNVGSAVGNTVPWRTNVDQLIAGLAENEEGLWLLAVAANAFDAERECANSFSPAQLLSRDQAEMYTIPDVDLARPDRLRRDRGGVAALALTPWRLVLASDPVRARELEDEEEGEDTELDIAELIETKRRALVRAIETAEEKLDDLLACVASPEAKQTTLTAFGSLPEWEPIDDRVRALAAVIYNHRPEALDEDDEDEETEEDWE
ncbi:hypothetical protein DEJ50_25220 [Streptomyces venezuelae]|uniref:Uncharacterized protein n=1 Tax=Streptomyces venezuelae TaxID=54571 RepID=A0A5P2D7B0_STRVZ|nr:hypothetical protein [Streptomyces venezuelae]QES50643.1 hypothetical protein DEJ50_25220 [Streptomyces venezuelae]